MWQSVTEYINRRRQAGIASSPEYSEHMIGGTGGQFAYNRDQLLRSVVQEARRVVENYDRKEEAANIAQDMRSAVGLMIGAGGIAALGILITATVAASFIDITGITAALVSGAVGLFILPYRKRRAQQEFRRRTLELRDKLSQAMTEQFNTELARSIERIRGAIAPYTRFVRMEQERMVTADARLSELERTFDKIRAEVELIGR
jgi:hypothetical protein